MKHTEFSIVFEQNGGEVIDAGRLKLSMLDNSDASEADAAARVLSELNVTKGMVQWRGVVMPVDRLAAVRAVAVACWIDTGDEGAASTPAVR